MILQESRSKHLFSQAAGNKLDVNTARHVRGAVGLKGTACLSARYLQHPAALALPSAPHTPSAVSARRGDAERADTAQGNSKQLTTSCSKGRKERSSVQAAILSHETRLRFHSHFSSPVWRYELPEAQMSKGGEVQALVTAPHLAALTWHFPGKSPGQSRPRGSSWAFLSGAVMVRFTPRPYLLPCNCSKDTDWVLCPQQDKGQTGNSSLP